MGTHQRDQPLGREVLGRQGRCMWDAPAFHHGPRPLPALSRARSAFRPKARSYVARVTGRFHCRHSRQRSRRRTQLSSSSSTPLLSVS